MKQTEKLTLIVISLSIIFAVISTKTAYGLELKLTQGFAMHYTPSKLYNDTVFNDNHTSTNTLLTLTQGKYSLTLLSDSQGFGSMALIRSTRLSKRFSLIGGLYILRDGNISLYEPQSPVLVFPSIKVGNRDFLITPLIGLQHQLELTDRLSIDTLITPAFTLVGISIKL